MASAKAASGAERVALVAHSAGGWLARVYVQDFGTDDIAMVLSLGAPLNAVPKGVPGVVDQTRGILTYVVGPGPGLYTSIILPAYTLRTC